MKLTSPLAGLPLAFAGLCLAGLSLGLAGCSGNPTNEASAAEVQKSNADRKAAIDNDATLTPEQKEAYKAHLGGAAGSQASPERK